MFDSRPPAFLESQPQYGHAFAAWPDVAAMAAS
jgi:hypothetical protein